MIDNQALFTYVEVFNGKLADKVGGILSCDLSALSGIKAASLYGSELINAAAITGYKLKLQHEIAIAFMVFLEAARFARNHRGFKFLMPKDIRLKVDEHSAMYRSIAHLVKGSDMLDTFTEELVKVLQANSAYK